MTDRQTEHPREKRPRARTFLNEDAAAVPAGRGDYMSDNESLGGRSHRSQGSARGATRVYDRDYSSRKPPQRRAGRKHNDKTAILDMPRDDVQHHWMQMMSQSLHQVLGQVRKLGGGTFDTWILKSNHTLATALMRTATGHYEASVIARQERETARRESREVPAPLPNPAADFTARFIHELRKHSLGPAAKTKLDEIWANFMEHENIEEDVSYFNVSTVSEGEETRIIIGMKGWAMRAKLLDVMRQFGNDVRYSAGGPPPGYMERQLGEYCQALKEWDER